MTRIPYLDLAAQYKAIQSEVDQALLQVCESAQFAQGPVTAAFENEYAAYCGVRHCVTVNSGTSALHLALCCLNVGPGDEVITVPMTFIATAWAISYVGARPVFVDIDPARRTLDPKKLEAAITPRTKAIIPVHLFGMPAEMDTIVEIAKAHKIPIVEDAAQAHGARYKGNRVGQFGEIGCFSFYPGKNLGAYGEGGALVTNYEEIAERARRLRNHGQAQRYEHEELGYNYRMDSFQAAVLRVKLRHLDDWNEARQKAAKLYEELLHDSPVILPKTFPDSECVWHCYVIEAPERNKIRKALSDAGIDTGLHYQIPLHLQTVYRSLGYHAGDFPVTEKLCSRCLSLPIYPELGAESIRRIVHELSNKTV